MRASVLLFVLASCFSPNLVSGISNDGRIDGLGHINFSVDLDISQIKQDGALCSLFITSNSDEIAERGIVYNKLKAPAIRENKLLSTAKNDFFTIFLTNLEFETSYSVRGYVLKTNGEIYYSQPSVFTTLDQMNIDTRKPTEIVNHYSGYALIWSDEFNINGRPSPNDWGYEQGYVRNKEAQYYSDSKENSEIKDGVLIITARKDHSNHPYTSSSLHTKDKHHFTYGRFEIRAKIPTSNGCWPAIWTLGNKYDWPMGGEIDIMEFYDYSILANAAWSGNKVWSAVWDSEKIPLAKWTDKDDNWSDKYHVWRMDWNFDVINLYLDNELLNSIDLNSTFNQGWKGNNINPFRFNSNDFGQYFILNLALGGTNGGRIDDSAFPIQYKIDYIRVYQIIDDKN